MIKVEKYIPNLLTAGNLFCGFIGILFCFNGYWALGAFMVFTGGVLDWLDGLAARLLNSYSDLGKQLDSLADLTTFGILPGILAYQLIYQSRQDWVYTLYVGPIPLLTLAGFLIVIAAALRLSRFNNQPSKSFFSGLPTPAAGLLIASFPLIIEFDIWNITPFILNGWFVLLLCLFISALMISNLHFASIKFSKSGISGNLPQFIFVLASAILLFMFWFAAVPMIMILYFILSVIDKSQEKNEIYSTD